MSLPRRILTLTVVHPCESISPSTLLRSLLHLCRTIADYKPLSRSVHVRIVHESLREVAVLQSFFEHLFNNDLLIPTSVVLTFSEIHVALQKLHHLLYDCCRRRGTRLYLLMNSDRVSYEFRAIARSISTALDVLPLPSINAGDEMNELIRLLAAQTWRVPLQTDASDRSAAADVRTILMEIESNITPKESCLRRMLDRLQIRSWSECNEEIRFLEEELFAGDASVGGLIGLLAYCRAAMFDTVDTKKTDLREEGKCNCLSSISREDIRCPISLELMTDPVTIATGHTYDRSSIERWFAAGHLTCPLTGEKLFNSQFVPNSALRSITSQVYNSNVGDHAHTRKRDLSKTHFPNSLAIKMAADLLVDKLKTGDNVDRNKAAYEMRLLCKSSLYSRACLVDAGSVPWLLYLLYSVDPSTQENAVSALLNLSKHPDGRVAIRESGGIALIVEMVKDGIKLEARQNAAAILFYLSSIPEYRGEIGDSPDAIPSLVDLLSSGTFHGKKNSLVTLFGLLQFSGNYGRILAAGAVPVIASVLLSERDKLVGDAAAVLAKLAETREGTAVILASSAPSQMVKALQSSVSRSGREYCLSALMSLCNNGGEKVVSELGNMPLLMSSLYFLVTKGSPHAGKKARSLINQIHGLHDQDHRMLPAYHSGTMSSNIGTMRSNELEFFRAGFRIS